MPVSTPQQNRLRIPRIIDHSAFWLPAGTA
jgi:hypothetical protein